MDTIRDTSCRTQLIDRLNRLTGQEQPAWGKMNVDQMMSHLVQAGEFPFVASLPDRSSFLSRLIVKPLVLYVLPIPKEVKTPPDLDQQANGRKPEGFEADRKMLIDSINKLAELPVDHPCLYHPFFGKMTAKQWGTIAHKHINHHLRQFGV